MENKQEVRATGAMPGLELLVNLIKGLRFKVVKLSTYNLLKNQLKLKDHIIVNLNNNNEVQSKEIDKFKILSDEQAKLFQIIINEKVELENKYKRVNQPRIGGKFASKKQ